MYLRIDEITINGWQIPAPDKNGFKRTKNKLWSANTGRTASGKMVGDIVAVKYSLTIKWSELTSSDVTEIENAVSSSAFFPVVFPAEGTGEELTKNFYAADLTYDTKIVIDGEEIYKDFTIELIEQ